MKKVFPGFLFIWMAIIYSGDAVAHSGIVVLVKSGCNEFYLCVGNYHTVSENAAAVASSKAGIYIDKNRDGSLGGCCLGGGAEFIKYSTYFRPTIRKSWVNIDSTVMLELKDYFVNSSTFNPGGSKSFTTQEVWRTGSSCPLQLENWLIVKLDFNMLAYYDYMTQASSSSVVETPCQGTGLFYIKYAPGDMKIKSNKKYLCANDSVLIVADNKKNIIWKRNDTLINFKKDSIWVKKAGKYQSFTDTGCKTKTSNIIDLKLALPKVDLGADQEACDKDSITLKTAYYSSWKWSTGSTNSTITIKNSGAYSVKVIDTQSACPAWDTMLATFHLLPVVSLGSDTSFCEGSFHAMEVADSFKSVLWATGDTARKIMLANPYDPFWIEVTSHKNCKGTDTVRITSDPRPNVYIGYLNKFQCLQGNRFDLKDSSNVSQGIISGHEWRLNGVQYSLKKDTSLSFLAEDTLIVEKYSTTGKGCKSLTEITVVAWPMPQPGFAVSEASQCLRGNNFNFTNQSDIFYGKTSKSGQLTQKWTFGDMSAPDMNKNVAHTYMAFGKYMVELQSISAHGCMSKTTQNMQVFTHPVSDFKIQTLNWCHLQNVFELNDLSVIAEGLISKNQWDPGNGMKVANKDTVTGIHYLNTGMHTVQLVNESDQGCRDTINKNLTVYPNPAGDVLVSDPRQCLRLNAFDFGTNANIASGTINKYDWSFGDGSVSTLKAPSAKTFGADLPYKVQLILTSDKNCADTNTLDVIVDPHPVSKFTVQSDTCMNSNWFDFTNISSISKGNNQAYSWDLDENRSGNAFEPPIQSYPKTGNYNISLMVTSDQGCQDLYTRNITVYPNPVAAFDVDPVCFYYSSQFNNKSAISSGGISEYGWKFGDGKTSNLQDPLHHYLRSDSFDVQLIARSDKNCYDTLLMKRKAVVYPLPVAGFSEKHISSWEKTSEFEFTDASSDAVLWDWDFNKEFFDDQQIPEHVTWVDSGRKFVRLQVTNQYGCMDTMDKWIQVYPWLIYFVPNAFTPGTDAKNDLYFIAGLGYPEMYDLKIYTRWGERIFDSQDYREKWDGNYRNAPLPVGLYYFRLSLKAVGHSKIKQEKGEIMLLR